MSPAPATTPREIHPTANVYRSEIGPGTKVAAFVEIGGATVGARCKVQAFAFLCPGVVLEDEVFVGPHVCFTNDRYPRAVGHWTPERTLVERGAAIGARCLILPGVTIGAGAMIAAGSVVGTSVPAGHLYDGTPGQARLKRWYRSQAELDLPLTFDDWRRQYFSLSCRDQQAYYDAIYERFPEQEHGTLAEARRFFQETVARKTSVFEIGGWDGRIAAALLGEFPHIDRWWNYELCRQAVARGAVHPRYAAQVPEQFVWDLAELPPADMFFASHVIEHIQAAQLDKLAGRLSTVQRLYLEAPLPASATDFCWDGRWNTHILELGWEQVEQLFARHGFHVIYRAPDIRWLERDVS